MNVRGAVQPVAAGTPIAIPKDEGECHARIHL
jgi:hypothetical protein